MNALTPIDAIQEVSDEFDVRIADTPDLVRQSYQLRHQVYCTERSFLPGDDGLEYDEYDVRSRHVVLVARQTDEVLGSVRLVLPCCHRAAASFPMQEVCTPGLLGHLPLAGTAEISRFAISKERRVRASSGMMRLALIRGVFMGSRDAGATHWCAVMERSLLRLLAASSIHFRPLGQPVEYHGLRQPCWNGIADLADGILHGNPYLWRYITNDGAYVPEPGESSDVAACTKCGDVCRLLADMDCAGAVAA